MRNRQIDRKTTKQVRIDAGLHRELKIKAATEKTTIKALIEGVLADLLEVKPETEHTSSLTPEDKEWIDEHLF